ncbi:MAG TPA: cyclic 2,3-diphosphoglycerate synthase [candidate division Zixibacteria bacterium]|nr:GTPase [candidate division Zixibacteria bacterium]MDM7973710.1 cyclic 2,3-diphosphoglycerate synthase [candidate division Zixibacteria bacterium]HOD66429.1 cyclic 2,3-diphosphoglycerate synthase [candidate division Zixibacteria bacterium]HPM37276.1 cyclic 2,3-diphosphoglycerate synthase [candidate division Zixibacteria bacterium]
MAKTKKRIIIMGAAGRDFHNFNVLYRDNDSVEVVAFTATQIPDIEGRKYPKVLAGKNYPNGIPIHAEDELINLIRKHGADEVVFSYSDVPYHYIMQKAAYVMAAGARFAVEGGAATMLASAKPVVAVTAVRTGCGKSQTTRRVAEVLQALGKKVVAIRHPMPYGDLGKQVVQRFAHLRDLDTHKCTIEEREEYEPHIDRGVVVYAGVDYEKIIRQAEQEADVILWDGGNNDMSFYKPDLYITVVDPHRPGHEISYYPGQNNLLLADVVVINKIDSAEPEGVAEVRANVSAYNPDAVVIDAASPLDVDKPALIKGKRVLVVEDGPTLTHGEMAYGAGVVAAEKFGAAELVDPRPYTVNSISETFKKYPDIGVLLPAMGYGPKQIKDLETTINRTECDAVVIATPIDLSRIIKIRKPTVRVGYSLQEIGRPNLADVLGEFVGRQKKGAAKAPAPRKKARG